MRNNEEHKEENKQEQIELINRDRMVDSFGESTYGRLDPFLLHQYLWIKGHYYTLVLINYQDGYPGQTADIVNPSTKELAVGGDILQGLSDLYDSINHLFSKAAYLERIPRGNVDYEMAMTILNHNLQIYRLCRYRFFIILVVLFIWFCFNLSKSMSILKESNYSEKSIFLITVKYLERRQEPLVYMSFMVLLSVMFMILLTLVDLNNNYLPEDMYINYEVGKHIIAKGAVKYPELM